MLSNKTLQKYTKKEIKIHIVVLAELLAKDNKRFKNHEMQSWKLISGPNKK